jgi:hypothetical protein
VFNTVSSQFVGGPGFVPSVVQTAVGGVLNVRNLRVDTGGKLVITGPNAAVITATGNVEILGQISLVGGSSTGVNSLNTTNIPEPGASGQGGGGAGGVGSPLTSQSSPKGGNGFGAFNVPDAGGEGGETTWNEQLQGVANRRGAGGGGGILGANQLSPFAPSQGLYDQTVIGLDAEKGFNNELCTSSPPPKGAISGVCPSQGGQPGVSPFTDFDPNNNFYGSQLDQTNNHVIIGELKKPWAGAGGGAGGDASYTAGVPFPAPWNPTGDEKGSGGGGGAGGLRVMTLGNIVFGPSGQITAQGGNGGGGENTNFFNRVGGGSGGGSGGHVILESALKIDMSQISGTNQAIFAPWRRGRRGPRRCRRCVPRPGRSAAASADLRCLSARLSVRIAAERLPRTDRRRGRRRRSRPHPAARQRQRSGSGHPAAPGQDVGGHLQADADRDQRHEPHDPQLRALLLGAVDLGADGPGRLRLEHRALQRRDLHVRRHRSPDGPGELLRGHGDDAAAADSAGGRRSEQRHASVHQSGERVPDHHGRERDLRRTRRLPADRPAADPRLPGRGSLRARAEALHGRSTRPTRASTTA